MRHTPVLLNEVIKALDPKPGEFFIDGTAGGGGHSEAILNQIMPSGKLLIIDWDCQSLEKLHEQIVSNFQFPISPPKADPPRADNFQTECSNYSDLVKVLEKKKLPRADGLLIDLGFSSEQLGGGRGFSFLKDEPLLMTYDPNEIPVKQLLKDLNEQELAAIIKNYGEERYAVKIAKAIREYGRKKPIETTGQLVEAIKRAAPGNYERGRIHPATRTFMALRIYANRELENLETLLKNLEIILKPGGRAAIISFHSLEDRLVKNYFRNYAKAGKMEILTKKPITAAAEEIRQNPRARSAKLRAAILTPNP